MLARIGFERLDLPTLRTMTQAGGRLDPELVRRLHGTLASRGVRLFVMYGQTEATARMSYVPPERLPEKAASIGIAIPGGELELRDGELVYRGPNVMLGYATSPADLELGDVQHGELRTGDLGRRDDDGFHYVTGRLKRFSKVYGLRVSLDELEDTLRPLAGPVAVTGDDERIVVTCEEADERSFESLREQLALRYKINVNTFVFRKVERLPRLASGKVDYSALGGPA
jgi:acyl-CoA synthetase (AMP-forming)/AMP-acid ligase II